MDENFLRTVAELVRADGPFEWLLRLAGIGVGAAVSEELLFRGVILTGFRRLGRLGAILLSALLFTAMHGLLLPNYFVAGVVLGLAASATGSILVPISIHLFHNVAALLLFNLAEIETLGDPLWTPAGILIPALGILAIGAVVYLRGIADDIRATAGAEAREAPVDTSLPTPPPGVLSLARDLSGVPPGPPARLRGARGLHGRRAAHRRRPFRISGLPHEPGAAAVRRHPVAAPDLPRGADSRGRRPRRRD